MSFEKIQIQHSEHIEESSSRYEQFKEDRINTSQLWAEGFGEGKMEIIKKCKKLIEKAKENIANISESSPIREEMINMDNKHIESMQTILEEKINEIRNNLKKVFTNNFFGFVTFFDELAELPEILNLFQNRLDIVKHLNLSNGKAIGCLFLNNMVSDNELEKMMDIHLSINKARQEKFNKRLPGYIEEFKNRILEAMKNDSLPINPDLLESRIQETRVYLSDPLEIQTDINGTYMVDPGVIRVAPNLSEDSERHSVYHEFTHALSGRTIIERKKNAKTDIKHQRLGLRFLALDEKGEYTKKLFIWLNEAVTEDITQDILDINDPTYEKEREMLANLYKLGLSRETLYRAYFENYNPLSQDKIPAWKKLVEEISKINP